MSPPSADEAPGRAQGSIDLATALPFRLGDLDVRPATRQVLAPGGREVIAEPRVLQVLATLAQAEGAVVSRDALVQRCWDGRIVGEDAINRSIAKTRRLADLTHPPAFVIETIPRVGYRLNARTADGLVAAAPHAGRAGRVGRRAVIAAASFAVGGGAAFAGYRWLAPGPKADPLVAVLPFDNLSPDPELGYFADGLSEDILNAVIRGGGVRVTSSTSSFTFRGAAKRRAGATLKADYLLDGSVLRAGSRMRVNAHLTDVARQQTLWSESYDRDVGQGLQVEDEVAGRVAAALRVQIASAGPPQRWVDPAAYDLYLKGREATRVHEPQSLARGHELLQSAVEKAPGFAPAWFELAKNAWRSGFLEPAEAQQQGFELGRRAARRAIALDPRNGAAYGVIAEMTPHYGRWREVDQGLTRGLALSPNEAILALWRGQFLFQTGRLAAALQTLRRAQALDPLEILANHLLCLVLTNTGRFGEALSIAARLDAVWRGQLAPYWDRFWLLATSGRYAEAQTWLADRAKPPGGEPEEHQVLGQAMAAMRSGSPSQVRAAGQALLALGQEGVGYACNSMVLLAALGLRDEAVALARSLYLRVGPIQINRAIEFRGASRFPMHGEADPSFLFHAFMAPLRRAGRLNDIFDGIGLTDLWRATGPPDR